MLHIFIFDRGLCSDERYKSDRRKNCESKQHAEHRAGPSEGGIEGGIEGEIEDQT